MSNPDVSARLLHGDCLEEMAKIEDGSIDLVLCDPPYAVTQSKWDVVIPFEPMWKHLLRVAKHNAAFVFTSSQPFTTDLINSKRKLFKYSLVWEKSNAKGFLNAKRMPMRAHEDILLFYRKPPTYNPQKIEGQKLRTSPAHLSKRSTYNEVQVTSYSSTSRHPRSVIKIKSDGSRRHPNKKPVALMEWLIKSYSNPGETVLDFTMGAGTTGVAAMQTHRNFVGIEMDDGYFKVAQEDIESSRGQLLLIPH